MRSRARRFAVIGIAIAVIGPALVAPPSQAAGTTVASALGALPVAPSMTLGYAFKDFGSPRPAARDRRGCGEKERVLLASAITRPAIGPGCTLRGGTWLVGGRTVGSPGAIDVVPLVSEKGAWSQGAFGWSRAQQQAFVRWYRAPARECAVGSGRDCAYALQMRGSGGLSAQVTDRMTQTQPPLTCRELSGIVGILASWGLAVDPAARARIVAADCGQAATRVVPRNRVHPFTTTSLPGPYLSPESAARVFTTSTVLDGPPGPVIDDGQFGLHVPDIGGPAPSVPHRWLRLWDAKTGWEPLEQQRGTYYWKWIDDSVAYAEARGLRLVYSFGDTPRWAGPSSAFPPTSLDDYRRYVEAVVSRYGNRIAAYEVWNEPNLYSPISDQVANLVDMTVVLHDVVRAKAPGSLVLTPSTTMRTDTAVYPFLTEYLMPLAKLGWPVDGYTVHTYPRASGGPAARAAHLSQFKQMLTLAGAPAHPIWDTEVNYGLGGLAEAKRSITGPEASSALIQTFLDSVRLGVSQTDWYLWSATDYPLLGVQLTPQTTDTAAAWRWVHDQLVGSRLRGCATAGAVSVCGLEQGGRPFALAWSGTGEPSSVAIPTGLTRACTRTGVCTAVSDGRVTVGPEPLRISGA